MQNAHRVTNPRVLTRVAATSKRLAGRPKAEDPRRPFSIHFSSLEWAKVKVAAGAVGEPVSVYVRNRALLDKTPRFVPSLNRSDWAELGKLFRDVRKLADAISAGRIQTINDQAVDLLSDLCSRLRDLRLALLAADGGDE